MAAPVIHFEIGCRDKASTQRFYQQLFGWGIREAGSASMIHTGSDKGIQGHINCLGHEPHNFVTFYVQVDDLAASLARVEAMGGKILVPPTDIPGGMSFAWFSDPEGNRIGLLQQ